MSCGPPPKHIVLWTNSADLILLENDGDKRRQWEMYMHTQKLITLLRLMHIPQTIPILHNNVVSPIILYVKLLLDFRDINKSSYLT